MLLDRQECDIFVASKIGSFKHIKYHSEQEKNTKKRIENLQDIKTLQKDDAITCLSWSNAEQSEILVGRKNQQVQIYSTLDRTFTKTVIADYGKGEVVGVSKLKRSLVSALAGGVVKVWSKKKEKEILLDTGGALDRMRCKPDDPSVIATGGQENDLKVWRLGEPAPIFQAKNVANDWLELRTPVWVSDLCFLPGDLLATCSRHGFVRLYDTRAQRRPVCTVEFKGMAATCICPSSNERQVFVGFGRGQMHQVDLRNKGHPDKGYKGSVGALSDIALLPGGCVVSTSLDRHLKVHDINTKQLLYKQYLTSKLSCVLVQTATSTPLLKVKDEDAEVKDEEEQALVAEDAGSEDDLDVIFEKMETIKEKPKKKKLITELEIPVKRAKKTKIVEEEPTEDQAEPDEAIVKLLRSTEKKKRKLEKTKKAKKTKSVFHNA